MQNPNKSIMGRHKKAACEKCMRVMRKDHLKRHMKVHENGKMKMNVAESLELGRIVVEAVKSMGIAEESLRNEYKIAKNLYLKHMQNE